MAISQNKYVDVNSTFPETTTFQRSFGGLVFTKSRMLVPDSTEDAWERIKSYDEGDPQEMSLTEVSEVFGESSAEYQFAAKYYGYSSPSGQTPSALKFARVLPMSGVTIYETGVAYSSTSGSESYVEYAGTVYKCSTAVAVASNKYWNGGKDWFGTAIAEYVSQAYNVGAYCVHADTVGSTTTRNLYMCTTAIESGEDWDSSKWTKISDSASTYAADTSYDAGSFVKHEDTSDSTTTLNYYQTANFVPASENPAWDYGVHNSFTAATTSDTIPTVSYEMAATALARVDQESNLFGSFTFLNSGDLTFDDSDLRTAVATNSGFGTRYLCAIGYAKGSQTASAMVTNCTTITGGSDGVAFVQSADGLSAYMPMAIFAATDYDKGGQVTCQMFKQFASETPTVKSDADYTTLSAGFVNFYGQTQSNGKKINFYQRGYNADGTDTAIYCNEVWFKSVCATNLMQLLLDNERVMANNEGVALVQYTVGEVCEQGAQIGAFMPKTIGSASLQKIRTLVTQAGGTSALVDEINNGVGNVGYYVWAFLTEGTDNEYYIHYYVFYGTADSIRYIKGDDILVK